jgi:predicted PurR-regulated permease PerM
MAAHRNSLPFLAALTAGALALSAWIAWPFLEPLAAALLAIVFYPLRMRLSRGMRSKSWAAGLSLALVVVALATPAFLLGATLVQEIGVLRRMIEERSQGAGTGEYLLQLGERAVAWAGQYVDVSQVDLRGQALEKLQAASGVLLRAAGSVASNVGGFLMSATIALFTLFFLFRDGDRIREWLVTGTPADPAQMEQLLTGIADMIHASVYGVLAVAAAQGFLAGAAYWFLGVPAPVLWGAVTAVFSLVPVVGSAAVWVPVALSLGLSGHWGKAAILAGWGAGVVGMVDNFLRPYILSEKVNMHPLLLFFALLGGVQAFGLTGLFAGPVILAVTQTLIGLVRQNLAAGETGAATGTGGNAGAEGTSNPV